VGRGRLLGGGTHACIKSSTNPLVTSRSRSSSASSTAGTGGSGVARLSGFLRCALGGSSPDCLGARGFFLLYSPPSPVLLGSAGFPVAGVAGGVRATYLAMVAAITSGSKRRAAAWRGGSGGRGGKGCRYGVYWKGGTGWSRRCCRCGAAACSW
jgi:hypothetical protein